MEIQLENLAIKTQLDANERRNRELSIILDRSARGVREVVQRMVEANNHNDSDSRIILDHQITAIHIHDSYKLSTTMCKQLSKGVFLMLGASSAQSFNVIQSYSQALHVPYVTYSANRNRRADGYDFDFSVSPNYIDAVIDVIKFFDWKKMYYLFDSDDGLWQLQQLYESFQNPEATFLVDARRVRDSTRAHDLLRHLDRISRSERKRIILNFSSAEVYQSVLNQIVDVGMNRENYHYLLAGPDIDKLNLNSFKYGGVNVTGFRLPIWRGSTGAIAGNNPTRNGMAPLSTEAALALDGLQTVLSALNGLLNDLHTRHIFKTFRHGQLYNNNTRGIQCWTHPAKPWVHGSAIKDALAKVRFHGVTGPVEYNKHGQRRKYSLEIMHLSYKTPLRKVGMWSAETGVRSNVTGEKRTTSPSLLPNRTRVVTTILENPFLVYKCPTDGRPCTDNHRYEGYCADLIHKISEIVQFQYVLKEVTDHSYGSRLGDGSWNGMIGELIRRDADIAVAALSISEVRERVVDFSKPYMDTGTSIMIKKPDKQQGGVFSFKSPLSDVVWLSIAFGFLAVSIVLFLVGRQLYCDGHKSGDPECKLPASSETKGSTDSPTTDTTDMLEIMDTNTGDKQKQDDKKSEKKLNKANSVDSHDRSRPRDKKKQTTLGTYRKSGSQSIKRPRSKDSLSSQSDKQMKLQEQNDHETDDDETEYCEPPDHIA
ncbi:hypothetical protein ACOMHN_053096 [Nucella lapillus]